MLISLRNVIRSPQFWVLAALLVFMLLCADFSHAATTSGMPWETPLQRIQRSFAGPVAFAISIVGLIGAGAGLIWGGEISGFIRTLIFVVLVISLLVFANSILTKLFHVGALVPEHTVVHSLKLVGNTK